MFSCIVLFGLAGCSSRGPSPVAPVDLPNKPGAGWFCEMHANGEEWECVRDENLARHPKPSRLPKPEPTPAPIAPQPLPPTPEPPPVPPTPIAPVPTVNESAASIPEPVSVPVDERIPKHIRLAYKPETPTNIVELPPDFYAVQLIAMDTREALEAFVNDNRLRGMSAARVEKDEQVFFVLLLGIYTSAAIAKEASEEIPPPLDELPPWIRSLGSLQRAMIRADEISGADGG